MVATQGCYLNRRQEFAARYYRHRAAWQEATAATMAAATATKGAVDPPAIKATRADAFLLASIQMPATAGLAMAPAMQTWPHGQW